MKKNKSIAIFILLIIITVFFTSCTYDNTKYDFSFTSHPCYFETEYFMCRYSYNAIAIGGLTESGQYIEELVMPEEIDGIEVVGLGHFFGDNEFIGNFNKIFIPKNIYIIDYQVFSESTAKVIFLSKEPNFSYPRDRDIGGDTICKASAIENYQEAGYTSIKSGNISFFHEYNYSEEHDYLSCHDEYWIDYVEEGELIKTVPPDPVCKDCVFKGWYKDHQCTIKWDFENDIPFPIEEESNEELTENTIEEGIQENEQEDGEELPEEEPSLMLYAKWGRI